MLIGQDKLRAHFDKVISSNSLPKFIILIGQRGQGRGTLAMYIAKQLKADLYVPQDKKVGDVREMIADAQALPNPRVYLLSDSEDMTNQAQNALLKLAEEPPKNVYIIMTVETDYLMLPTIVSRAKTYRLDSYNQEQLKQETDNELLLTVCTNIGQIKRLKEQDIQGIYDLCTKIIVNIKRVSAANVFNITRHIDLDNLDLFLLVLTHVMGENLQTGQITNKEINVLYNWKRVFLLKGATKQNALEMMFLEMRGA